jgi:hypothetical protein
VVWGVVVWGLVVWGVVVRAGAQRAAGLVVGVDGMTARTSSPGAEIGCCLAGGVIVGHDLHVTPGV